MMPDVARMESSISLDPASRNNNLTCEFATEGMTYMGQSHSAKENKGSKDNTE